MLRLFIFGLLTVVGYGATYYVDVNGDDTHGDGSLGTPWATITHALDSATDGDLILVKPGTYSGRIRLRGIFPGGITVRSEVPYQAKLRHSGTVITCFDGIGITLEGFDIAHSGPGASALVIQVQDLLGSGPGGDEATSFITFRDNVIHDSYNNDLLKINYGARDILVEGNLFFNQQGSDEHMDINGVVRVEVTQNIFLNAFELSGRLNANDTSSFIVVKNSGQLPESGDVTIHRNVFLNWQGSTGHNFVLIGEDGLPQFEAQNILVENNLMLGNSQNTMRSAFGVKGGKDIVFRNNTIVGDLPSMAYAMRLNTEGSNPPNENVHFYNNIWSDPTGSMGAPYGSQNNDFSDTPVGETQSFMIDRNLFWNGGEPIPSSPDDLVNYDDDGSGVVQDPLLPDATVEPLPFWDSQNQTFLSSSQTIHEEFVRLVELGAQLSQDSPAVDQALPEQAPEVDILGTLRGAFPDLGSFEIPYCGAGFDLDHSGQLDGDDLGLALPSWKLSASISYDGNPGFDIRDAVRIVNEIDTCSP